MSTLERHEKFLSEHNAQNRKNNWNMRSSMMIQISFSNIHLCKHPTAQLRRIIAITPQKYIQQTPTKLQHCLELVQPIPTSVTARLSNDHCNVRRRHVRELQGGKLQRKLSRGCKSTWDRDNVSTSKALYTAHVFHLPT